MTDERRRYFRIDDDISLLIQPLADDGLSPRNETAASLWDRFSEQDARIVQLLRQAEQESPVIAELALLLHQKLERVAGQMVMDCQLLERVAERVQQVNISACGMALVSDVGIAPGSRLQLELCLLPTTRKISLKGIVVGCDPTQEGYFWRIDFYGMSQETQEALIQHIVRRQSAQLNAQFNI